jgi:protein-S-isoprenylcysteine O-methyltransferase Ste14
VTILAFVQGYVVMSKSPYGDLFPAAIDTTILSWLLMIGLPLAMLFLVLDKWQWHAAPVPIPIEQQSRPLPKQ